MLLAAKRRKNAAHGACRDEKLKQVSFSEAKTSSRAYSSSAHSVGEQGSPTRVECGFSAAKLHDLRPALTLGSLLLDRAINHSSGGSGPLGAAGARGNLEAPPRIPRSSGENWRLYASLSI